ALRVGQSCDSVRCAANLVGVGRLEVLEFEIDFRAVAAEVQLYQGRSQHRPPDSRPCLLNICQGNGPHRLNHLLSSQSATHPPLGRYASRITKRRLLVGLILVIILILLLVGAVPRWGYSR